MSDNEIELAQMHILRKERKKEREKKRVHLTLDTLLTTFKKGSVSVVYCYAALMKQRKRKEEEIA